MVKPEISAKEDKTEERDADLARGALVRAAFRLEWLTVGWMLVEAGVALAAGHAAHSLLLESFGLDSIIELFSAGVLIWRLSVELRRGRAVSEAAERRAGRIAGGLLFGLALYVVGAAGLRLLSHRAADFSLPGLLVSLAAIPVMYALARRKLSLADRLGSKALRADAMESIACGWLSFVVAGGMLARLATDVWWLDPALSLVIVGLLVKEGLEALRGECCHCAAD